MTGKARGKEEEVPSSDYCYTYTNHLLLLIVCSMHSTCGVLYCFGGVCAAASTILVVAIAEF